MAEVGMDRPCGDCSVCCTHKPINTPDLTKAPGIACQHSRASGCAIYEDRFAVCRAYRCGWKHAAWLSEAMRPDRSGVLIDFREIDVPAYDLEATVLVWRDPADLERNPVPDVIASLVEHRVRVQLSRPGPPGMLHAQAVVNERLAEAVRTRNVDLLFTELRACVQALEGHDWEAFEGKTSAPNL